MTKKIHGSNFIHCMNVPKNYLGHNTPCDTHWCWVCGMKSSEADICKHMSIEHGGFFAISDD